MGLKEIICVYSTVYYVISRRDNLKPDDLCTPVGGYGHFSLIFHVPPRCPLINTS